MRKGLSGGGVRRNIILSAQSRDRLRKLQGKLDVTSETDVIRVALKLLEQIMNDQEQGLEYLVRNPSGPNGELERVRWL